MTWYMYNCWNLSVRAYACVRVVLSYKEWFQYSWLNTITIKCHNKIYFVMKAYCYFYRESTTEYCLHSSLLYTQQNRSLQLIFGGNVSHWTETWTERENQKEKEPKKLKEYRTKRERERTVESEGERKRERKRETERGGKEGWMMEGAASRTDGSL